MRREPVRHARSRPHGRAPTRRPCKPRCAVAQEPARESTPLLRRRPRPRFATLASCNSLLRVCGAVYYVLGAPCHSLAAPGGGRYLIERSSTRRNMKRHPLIAALAVAVAAPVVA